MKQERERGAIVVEATISLTAFIFAILTILLVVDISYTQARIGTALNSSTKEISQYCILYYKLGLDKVAAAGLQGTDDARDAATKTVDGIAEFMDALSGTKSSWNEGDFEGALDSAGKAGDAVSDTASMWADKLAEDPKALIFGMGKLMAADGVDLGKSALGGALAKAFMKKNLRSAVEQDPEHFLKSHRVVGGIGGLDFQYSTLMYGGEPTIQMVVTYEVEVIKLLGIDFKFKFRQCAISNVWGGGVSSGGSSS